MWATWLLAISLVAAPAPARAAAPLDASARALLRVLAYDKALAERSVNGKLVLGVVYEPSDPVSAAQAQQTLAAIRALRAFTAAGLAVGEPLALPRGRAEWDRRLSEVTAAFVCRGLEAELPALAAAAARVHRPLLALDDASVGQGAAVGIAQHQARLRVVVDLAASRAQGMDPSTELLEFVQLLEGP